MSLLKLIRSLLIAVSISLLAHANALADTATLVPLSERFSGEDITETPDFQRHVVPLLGRLGCNGRSCHGSFQGRGDFRLSLFGYDFKADYEALLDESTGRVDLDDVDESLMLAKPTDADIHEGGQRFETGSWQHHVLRRWVEAGAKYDSKKPQALVKLDVTPAEIQFTRDGENVTLSAVAHWQDGSSEDVTELCRFSSNDDSIAAIDEKGYLTSGQQGGTHVIVFYDNAVVPVPVMRPFGPTPEPNLSPPDSNSDGNFIDPLVAKKLAKLGVQSSATCTDDEFIRRASLDITGVLPSADTVREFLADTSPEKRAVLIDELLDSPGYAAWWATRFSDWTGNSEEQLNNVLPIRNVASKLWYEWLRYRIETNVPYDELVEGIVTAQSRQPGEDYLQYCEAMTKACEPGGEESFAMRDGLPLFWGRRNFQKPEERAIGFAYSFLGVRIECAQCHKHPFDQWSKDDFDQFANVFTPIRSNPNQVAADAKKTRDELLASVTGDKKLNNGELRKAVYQAAKDGNVVPFGELLVNTRTLSEKAMKARKIAEKKGRKLPPINSPTGTILGQTESLTLDKDPRDALMSWLRSPQNPYFAKAIVNRVWSNYFGIGIVDPSDDMNLANPPSNAPLLDELARQFIAHDFDLRWLHRVITNSQTYQRSALTNQTNGKDQTNFSHHVPRRLPAEVVFDCVVLATGSDEYSDQLRTELDDMAIADGKPRVKNRQEFALEVFGQSIRESNCDCDRSDSPSLLQSIYLRNDIDMHRRLADKDGWVQQACKAMGVAGPNAAGDPQAMAIRRRTIAMQQQLVNRINQFKKLPEAKQERQIRQIQGEFARVQRKFQQQGLIVPSFKELLADPTAWKVISEQDQILAASDQSVTFDQLVEEAYLRTLSRFPSKEETEISVQFVKESKSPADGLQSLLWALVNTKEFVISH